MADKDNLHEELPLEEVGAKSSGAGIIDDPSKIGDPKKRSLLIAATFAIALVLVVVSAFLVQDELLESYDDVIATLPGGTDSEWVGQTAPDFSFLGENGHVQFLSDYRGTPIVLNFWATWCPPCRMEKPHFQQAFDQYGNDVKFIILNVDEPIEVVRAYADAEGFTFPLYFDEAREGAIAFEAAAVPASFFIDADGIIRAHYLGAINFNTIERSILSIME